MNRILLEKEIQQFIEEHENDIPAELMLRVKAYPNWPMKDIVEQIASRRKAKQKLPDFYSQSGLIWPATLSMEQCSSQTTAEYKASLVSGKSMADLTGGFGVDTYYLSRSFQKVFHVERNEHLQKIAEHNFKQLGSKIQSLNLTAEDFLEKRHEAFDLLYLDPARRDEEKRKVVFLDDYSPNVIELLPSLLEKTEKVLIKTSPMLDLKKAIGDLQFVEEVHVVAVKNEVKEVLFLINKSAASPARITCVNLESDQSSFEFNFEKEANFTAKFAESTEFLYEPNASILKAGAFNQLAVQHHLKKLDRNTHLYTSDQLISGFPGRVFHVIEELSLNKKKLKKRFKKAQANITVRNYPMSVTEIRKKTGLKEGGTDYIFACTDLGVKKLLLCEKIK